MASQAFKPEPLKGLQIKMLMTGWTHLVDTQSLLTGINRKNTEPLKV